MTPAPAARASAKARVRASGGGAPRAVINALGVVVLLAGPAVAQSPVANAKVETRSALQGLEREVQAIAATRAPTWIGYRLPAAAGSRRTCSNGSRIMLESPSEFLVLARLEAGQVVQLRTVTPECDVDAGGMPLAWLNDVNGSESVAWLAKFVAAAPESRDGMDRFVRPALRAIGMHAGDGAAKLVEIARTARNTEVRKQAMARLGESRDPRAMKLFEEILIGK